MYDRVDTAACSSRPWLILRRDRFRRFSCLSQSNQAGASSAFDVQKTIDARRSFSLDTQSRTSLCSFLECRNQLAVLTCKPKSMVNNGSGFYKLTPEQIDKPRSYRTFKFNSNEQIHVYRLLLLFIAPPV